MNALIFKVTATISKEITINVNPDDFENDEQMLEHAQNEANESFNPNEDSEGAKYTQEAQLVTVAQIN